MGNYGCADENCACACHTQHECCHHHHDAHHEEKNKVDYFLELADEAWEEVLKEKIKEYIRGTQNDSMVKLAKMVAEANHKRWRNNIEQEQEEHYFMEELQKFFSKAKK